MTIETLAAQLEAASIAYGLGKDIMSDAAYDALEQSLRDRAPDHPTLAKVGAPISTGWPKVTHPIPLGSLDKSANVEEFLEWCLKARISATELLILSGKLDGIAALITYIDGKVHRAETRGDGVIGEDITRNVRIMKGVPKTITTPGTAYVRGEITLLQSDFDLHFQEEIRKAAAEGRVANPRNTASGAAKRQKTGWRKAKHLTFKAYNLTVVDSPYQSRSEELEALELLGFITPPWELVTKDRVTTLRQEYIDGDRGALDFDIDGLVVEINDTQRRLSKGDHNLRPKGATAYKFPSKGQSSVLRQLPWQVGNSGRITPVAVFDAVELAGASVTRASLYNVAYLADLASQIGQEYLAEGDEILVARQGDVIPRVIRALAPAQSAGAAFIPPTECPECGAPTNMDGEYLVCVAGDCPAQVIGMMKRWIEKVGVLHFGDALLSALIEADMVSTIGDLYRLDEAKVCALDMNGRRVGGSGTKALKNLHAKKELTVDQFVGSLGISLVGRKMVKLLVDAGFDDLGKLSSASERQMASVPGFGPGRAAAFRAGFDDKKNLIVDILAGGVTIVKPVVAAVTGSGMVDEAVCFTGVRDKEAEAEIVAQGGKIASGVSKNTTILVCKAVDGKSGKLTKARSLGIEILSVSDLWERLGG